LGGPATTGAGIQRLLALGVPLLLPILWSYKFTRSTFFSFIGLEFLVSLHHHFSFLNYFEISKYSFLAIVLIVAFLSFSIIRPTLPPIDEN
jgi:type IV secretory pathway TraG/TraD family ATPase VirD4